MRDNLRFRPTLSGLEERWTPATVKLIGSTMYITNPVGASTISVVANNLVQFKDSTTQVTMNAPGGVNYTGVAGTDNVTVNVTAGTTLAGNLAINTAGGSDVVSINGNGTGKLTGNVLVNTGDGSDSTAIGNTSGIEIFGATQLLDSSGVETVAIGTGAGAATTLRGDLTITGANALTLGNAVGPNAFLGTVSATTVNEGGVTVNVNPGSLFSRDFNVTTGTGNDSVNLGNNNDGVNNINAFGGNVNINLGGGNNTLTANAAATQSIFGNFTYTGLAGTDSVSLDSTFKGLANATLNLGDGTNTLDPAGVTKSFDVLGNLTINAGSGTDTINNFAANVGNDLKLYLGDGTNSISFNHIATIGGNFLYNAGNGANTADMTGNGLALLKNVTFTVGNGGNQFLLSDAQSIGGTLSVTTGNGNDLVSLLGSASNVTFSGGNGSDTVILGNTIGDTYNVNLQFGSGDDSIVLAGLVTGTINGDGSSVPGGNTGTQTVASLASPVSITNFILTVVP